MASVSDRDAVRFLQWALPRLGLRWAGYRRVRRQVRRRLAARIRVLGLGDLAAYRAWLLSHSDEWVVLDAACRVTISRFYRDRRVWDRLGELVGSAEVRAAAIELGALRVWSAGCASGEEPYTLALLWAFELAPRFAGVELSILATDTDPALLARARRAIYPAGCLRDLPESWLERAFEPTEEGLRLRRPFREPVRLEENDVRAMTPPGPFDLVLCRNLAMTYFDDATALAALRQVAEVLRPGGLFVVGGHEVERLEQLAALAGLNLRPDPEANAIRSWVGPARSPGAGPAAWKCAGCTSTRVAEPSLGATTDPPPAGHTAPRATPASAAGLAGRGPETPAAGTRRPGSCPRCYR